MLPSLFISNGAPTLLIDNCPAHDFLKSLGNELAKPKAILIVSAHWETDKATITAGELHTTIYDFYNFPPELYTLKYAAKGNLKLAQKIQNIIATCDLAVQLDKKRGLDHGAWVPLSLMYPYADIPVLQLSIQPKLKPEHHYKIGQSLKVLRSDGVIIIGSGSATHNLQKIIWDYKANKAPEWVSNFNEWLSDKITSQDIVSLFNYKEHNYGLDNHPSSDHILPLFVALGAGDKKPKRLHHSYTYGVLSMDAYIL